MTRALPYGAEPRVRAELLRPARRCGHETNGAPCHAPDVRPYLTGDRCPAHTPAALAGHPEPGRTAYPAHDPRRSPACPPASPPPPRA